MSSFIHETAIVSPQAELGEDCHIGAYSTVGGAVVLGNQVYLESRVVIADGSFAVNDDVRFEINLIA